MSEVGRLDRGSLILDHIWKSYFLVHDDPLVDDFLTSLQEVVSLRSLIRGGETMLEMAPSPWPLLIKPLLRVVLHLLRVSNLRSQIFPFFGILGAPIRCKVLLETSMRQISF